MPQIEYLDPSIANEGERADAAFVPSKRPHVWDYAALKEDPHYAQYFAPDKPRKPWPAWIYNHKTGENKIVGDAKTAEQYGVSFNSTARFPHYVCTGDWQDEPRKQDAKPSIHDTGKSVVTASAQQMTADSMTKILARLAAGKTDDVSPEIAAAIGQDKEYQAYLAFKRMQASESKASKAEEPKVEDRKVELAPIDEKKLLLEAAASRDIKIDKRWSLDRIKTELDKAA